MSAGGSFKWVWVQVGLQLPMGYPCYSLGLIGEVNACGWWLWLAGCMVNRWGGVVSHPHTISPLPVLIIPPHLSHHERWWENGKKVQLPAVCSNIVVQTQPCGGCAYINISANQCQDKMVPKIAHNPQRPLQ